MPGPWTVGHLVQNDGSRAVMGADGRVARVDRLDDCALIAAAPDLLDALQRIAASEEECGCTHDTKDCCNEAGVFCARCIAAAALVKAGVA